MESAVRATTVPSRLWGPDSLLREWVCSYCEKISLKDSAGSLAGAGAETDGSGVFGSGMLGLDMILGLKPCGVIPGRIPPLRADWRAAPKDEIRAPGVD